MHKSMKVRWILAYIWQRNLYLYGDYFIVQWYYHYFGNEYTEEIMGYFYTEIFIHPIYKCKVVEWESCLFSFIKFNYNIIQVIVIAT